MRIHGKVNFLLTEVKPFCPLDFGCAGEGESLTFGTLMCLFGIKIATVLNFRIYVDDTGLEQCRSYVIFIMRSISFLECSIACVEVLICNESSCFISSDASNMLIHAKVNFLLTEVKPFCQLDSGCPGGGDSNSAQILAPGVYLSPTRIMVPPIPGSHQSCVR